MDKSGKPRIAWDRIDHKTVVWCKTEEEATAFLAVAEEHGMKWISETKPTDHTNWACYETQTCYKLCCDDITYASRSFYEERGYTITPYADLLMPECPRICEVLGGKDNPLEVGEVFTIKGYPNRDYRYAVVHTDGKLHNYLEEPCQTSGTRVGNKIGVNALYWLFDHPEAIIRKPRFTQEEVAVLKALQVAGIAEIERGLVLDTLKAKSRAVNDGDGGHYEQWFLPKGLLPSLRPGQAVALKDITHDPT